MGLYAVHGDYMDVQAEVEKVKSVSGNLRIGPKTFCKNRGVRHKNSCSLSANECKVYLMSTK